MDMLTLLNLIIAFMRYVLSMYLNVSLIINAIYCVIEKTGFTSSLKYALNSLRILEMFTNKSKYFQHIKYEFKQNIRNYI